MYRIAIVEDEEQDYLRAQDYLNRYGQEKNISFNIQRYESAEVFLTNYQSQHDIVFMDIRMSGMDGMRAARKLREMDQAVILIFLTSLAQYAVQGYEVDALDYILKPLAYPSLELKLTKALSRCKKEEEEILLTIGTDHIRISADSLLYVEVFEHHLQYKTDQDIIKSYGTLKDVEKMLPQKGFFRLNNQTIVNLRRVKRVNGSTATVGDREFDISRMRKKDFLSEFHRYGING